ncbi:MAG: glycosyltransferase family 4 protein [Patescibacteria group bacterium]|nr:glycosyltransferase family 4 protein [Patescibacteria group bacterium]MBU1871097.1 glycosyltransferase family 4 protein [Patescibacteria group bacterium]
MKVALVSLGPKGGAVHYVFSLANALVKYSEVIIITADYVDETYFSPKIKIIKVKTGKNRKGVLLNSFNIFNFYKIWKIFSNINVDIVHFASQHPWNFIVSFFVKQPIAYTLHDPKTHLGENPLVAFFYYLMILRANKIFVHSKIYLKKMLERNFYSKRVHYIPHGVLSFFSEWQNKDIKEELSVLFFGRIEKYKGIKYLLQAFYLVQKKIPIVKLIIAGEGKLDSYKKLINSISNIQILNYFIPDSGVAKLFQKAKVVVLPYIEATQSGVPFIAYTFKKPAIVTATGGLPELVDDGETGYIVKPADSVGLAQAIIKILKNEKNRKKMGQKGFEKMSKEFSWDKIALKTIEIYKEYSATDP